MDASPLICPNCETALHGSFCHNCGQKKISSHDYALGHFFAHALHDITHFDSKIFRSLLPLFFKPGVLTQEYLAGKRSRFIKPVTLFVLLNLFFFLVGYRMGLLNWNLRGVAAGWHGALAQKLVAEKQTALALSKEEFAAHFNQVLALHQRNMFFFIIPMFAAALKLFYFSSRRYFVEHLIYSIHFHSFLLFYLIAGLLAFIFFLGVIDWALGTGLARFFGRDPGILIPIAGGILWYMLFALKRVYRQSWLATSAKAVGLVFCELVIVAFIYRPVLFFLTYFSM